MKTLLLLGGSMILLSCGDATHSNPEDSISDEEMKNRVEVEEIEVDWELKEQQLKDSMNVQDLRDGEDDNSSLGKMKDEVPKVFLPSEEKEIIAKRIYKEPYLGDAELPQLPYPSHGYPRPILDKNGVIDFPDIEAQYPGGLKEMKVFIADNLIYPDPFVCDQGSVYVTFVVEKDGCVTHAEVMRGGISAELNDEALRVVRAMPKWIPAKQNGEFVATRLRLPIRFTLN